MTTHRDRMIAIVDDLFATDSPKAVGPGPQPEPAIDCQILLRNGYQAQGVLARGIQRTIQLPNEAPLYINTLKFAAVAFVPHPDHPNNRNLATKIIAEHYFDYEDLMAVIVMRKVDPKAAEREAGPRIVTTPHG